MEGSRIRFRLDEHIPHAVAHQLRRSGLDVETADDADAVGWPDEDVLAACLEDGRVVVTFDRHYLRFDAAGVRHAGIVYAPQNSRSIGEVVEFLLLLVDVYTPADMVGRLEYM